MPASQCYILPHEGWSIEAWHSMLVLSQQPINSIDLILHPLQLIRPRPNPDIALDPHHAVGMQHAVRAADEHHDLLPSPLW